MKGYINLQYTQKQLKITSYGPHKGFLEIIYFKLVFTWNFGINTIGDFVLYVLRRDVDFASQLSMF